MGAVSQLLYGFVNPLMTMLAELLVILAITFLLLYNAFQSGMSLIIFLFLCIYLIYFTKRKLKHWGGMVLNLSAKTLKNLHHSIYGIKQIKIFRKERYFIENFKLLGEKFAVTQRNKNFFSQLPRVWIELISVFGLSLLMFFLIRHKTNVVEALSIVGIFVVAAFRLMPSANRLLNSLNEVRNSLAATKLVIDELKVKDSYPPNTSQQNINFTKHIKLTNIAFKYPYSTSDVLQNVNLTINKG